MKDFESERERLIRGLLESGYLRNPRVADVLRKVPRQNFVPDEIREWAYADTPQQIGFSQTISAPHMVAIMTELLDVQRNSNVLEIGTGSGYQAAILAELADGGRVVTVERIPELAEISRERLRGMGYSNVTVVSGDGTLGCPDSAPYDRIIVTAAAPDVPPTLVSQLAHCGRMLIPVGGRWGQTLLEVLKDQGGEVTVREHGGCVFVPLIGKEGW